jgi:hypothetical protein
LVVLGFAADFFELFVIIFGILVKYPALEQAEDLPL